MSVIIGEDWPAMRPRPIDKRCEAIEARQAPGSGQCRRPAVERIAFQQRINMGLYSVLAQLNATANWRLIAEELWPMVEGPPSTEMGHKEAAWLASRA